MRNISLWARDHRAIAIVLLITGKLLLATLAVELGYLLQGIGFYLPMAVCYLAFLIIFIAFIFYPVRSGYRKSKRSFYVRQKAGDFTIALCAFTLVTTIVNTGMGAVSRLAPPAYGVVNSRALTAEEILASLKDGGKKTLTRQEKRILKREFKKQLKVYAKAKLMGQKDAAGKAGLIILTIIAALGLLYLVAALACSLSCSGAEGAAAAVAIIGIAAVIIAVVFVIRRILRGPRKHTEYIS